MIRNLVLFAGLSLIVQCGLSTQEASAQDHVQQAGYAMGTYYGLPAAPQGGAMPAMEGNGWGPVVPGNTPQTGAPLYPAPIQTTPSWNGGAVITNQAFAPHEMLYPHRNRAMYGPFFYKVRGKFIWTPVGMRTFETWELQGTEVDVKYHDHKRLFSGFHFTRR